ncbi:hypothetical protein C9I92_01070 [Photobacterium ganghwense]|uniref:Phage protein n=1 Tax=Photobacterium ganghwense TaxID=320778 RepID=A0A0J1HAE6_9GAMM|nr:hypothetical protein [Photobacterium ganghwense]KLV08633.1 hypothetical protein ABT57_12440 [Photobacterium ganghwense]PSU10752.1 hypothetical protein C9I92_01070 [Photobacterium ganghwense]
MSDGIHLTNYHSKVRQWLAEQLEWVESVDYYPETKTQLSTPCLFFAVMDWDRADDQPMNGQLAVTLNCEILAVLGMADEQFQLEVRNAAMAIGLKVEGARFGLPVEPAVFISAEPDGFNPELDDYAVWSIRFSQNVEVGEDAFKPEGLTPAMVRVGVAPKIGAAHEADYVQVVPNE